MTSPLVLSRAQILAFRRRVGALDERLSPGRGSLRQAAWAGLQDSMPRAALLSIHARVEGAVPSSWEDSSLVQLWGPRFQVYVIAARDLAVFSLGRFPDDLKARRRAEDLAARLHALLDGATMPYGAAGDALGLHDANSLRYAATTGTVLIRWAGARQPTVWTVPSTGDDPFKARLELARRHLHVFGPSTPEAFARWAGISAREGLTAFDSLRRSLTAVRTPIGDAWILARDEPNLPRRPRARGTGTAAAERRCLLPAAGGRPRLLVPDADHRSALWTSRVWPGAVLLDGEISGTWRRANETVTIQTWRRPSRAARQAVEAEAAALPLPGLQREIVVRWND